MYLFVIIAWICFNTLWVLLKMMAYIGLWMLKLIAYLASLVAGGIMLLIETHRTRNRLAASRTEVPTPHAPDTNPHPLAPSR